MRTYFRKYEDAYARIIELVKAQPRQHWTLSQTLNGRWHIAPGFYRSTTAVEDSVLVFEPREG